MLKIPIGSPSARAASHNVVKVTFCWPRSMLETWAREGTFSYKRAIGWDRVTRQKGKTGGVMVLFIARD